MEIIKKETGKNITLSLNGRLDTNTSQDFLTALESIPADASLTADLENLSYISSAGLRALFTAEKKLSEKGSFTLCHVQDAIMEILDMTNFSQVFTIES